MNLRNAALLIFLIGLSFQSETSSLSSNYNYEQKEENQNQINNNENNNIYNIFLCFIVLCN
jgi:hypothetical protein